MSNVVRSVVSLLLLVLAQLGFSGTLPTPRLREGQFVYRIPAGFIPDKLSEHGLREMQEAAGRLHYPFYVVFVEELPTETGASTDDDTERAIVGLAEDWARDSRFNRNRATLFLVSYGPGDRKYKMLPAPLWRTELGLEYDALVPFTDIFRSNARQDPQSAITQMMAAFDRHVYDRFDPVRKAQRAEASRRQQEAARAEAARREARLRVTNAQSALDAQIGRLESALAQDAGDLPKDLGKYRETLSQARKVREANRVDAMEAWVGRVNGDANVLVEHGWHRRSERSAKQARRQGLLRGISDLETLLRENPAYLPKDLDTYRSNAAQARRVLDGNREEAIGTWSRQIATDLRQLQAFVEERRGEEAAARNRQMTILGSVAAGVLVLLGLAAVRWRRMVTDQAKVRDQVTVWRSWITQARQRYYLFDENRERAPHLREFGGKTGELYQATSREIDSIIIGVEAVATLLDTAEAKAKRATFLDRKPLDQALAALERPVTFETDRISEKLFEPVQGRIEITPSAFLANLSERYDAAVRDWQTLNESVTRSFELPDALFPHSGLDALLERAHAQGIPERWLAAHPLMGDAVADANLYAKVNECRLTDPYAYALQIDELKAREAEIGANLDRLIAAVALTRSRHLDAISGLDETVLHPDDDPQITLAGAHREERRVAELLQTADNVEAVEAQAEKTDALFAKTAEQIAIAREAIVQAPLLLEGARAAYVGAQALEGRANARTEQVARDHADVTAVRSAQGAGQRYLDAGARDLARAEAKLGERRHLGALRDAQQATNQFEHATAQMNGVLDLCAELDAMKARYMQRLAEMERMQRDAERRIRHYNGSSHWISDFRRPTYGAGPADFGYLLGLLRQQENEWNAAVRRAEREYEEEQRRRREEEEEERRRRQESLYRSSSSSSSFGSSSSSGSSGGSFSSGGSGSQGGSW